ncbi:MAG: hypothetical protein QXO02_08405 [Thermofilaceae archaeon]
MAVERGVALTLREPGRSSRRGQARLVELVLAVFMVVAVIIMVMNFTRPLRSVYLREVSDLRRLAYNLLGNLADAGAFERVLEGAFSGDGTWEGRMRMLVYSNLPPGIVFSMEVYSVEVGEGGLPVIRRLDSGGITNMKPGATLIESESIQYVYVCTRDPDSMRGRMLYVVLVIGYAG